MKYLEIPEQVSGSALKKILVGGVILVLLALAGNYVWNLNKDVETLKANVNTLSGNTIYFGGLTKSYCDLVFALNQGQATCEKNDKGQYLFDENGIKIKPVN